MDEVHYSDRGSASYSSVCVCWVCYTAGVSATESEVCQVYQGRCRQAEIRNIRGRAWIDRGCNQSWFHVFDGPRRKACHRFLHVYQWNLWEFFWPKDQTQVHLDRIELPTVILWTPWSRSRLIAITWEEKTGLCSNRRLLNDCDRRDAFIHLSIAWAHSRDLLHKADIFY